MHRSNKESYRNPVSRTSGQTQSSLKRNGNTPGVEATASLSYQPSGSVQSLWVPKLWQTESCHLLYILCRWITFCVTCPSRFQSSANYTAVPRAGQIQRRPETTGKSWATAFSICRELLDANEGHESNKTWNALVCVSPSLYNLNTFGVPEHFEEVNEL